MPIPFRTVAVIAAMLVLLAGCASPASRFYILSSVPGSPAGTGPVPRIVKVGLPDILDRPQIARRIGANRIDYAETDRWAASLDDLARRALNEDLASRYPAATSTAAVAPALRVDIDRFDADEAGNVTLEAHWTAIADQAGIVTMPAGTQRVEVPSHGTDAEAIVATMSEALGRLADRIAAAPPAARPEASR